MTRVYYKDAVGAFVVFDVTRMSTFEAVKKWKSDIDAKVCIPGTEQPIPVVLLANKIDLVPQDGEEKGWGKTPEEMDAFCKEQGFVTWFVTSAKDNVNVDAAANSLVAVIMEKVIQPSQPSPEPPQSFSLSQPHPDPPAGTGCCGD
eukprot:TRINITY_DN2775_c0_g1_i2.p1 TRINITY_DN2775_c0_g1~~TRINITY_DN2775_c0_g1_i2.p1  ORF type:complete len:146 (-),score=39.34 TRINITY_DN2775_c0_g1_i2:72-509(-)